MNSIVDSEFYVLKSSSSKFDYSFDLPPNRLFTHVGVTSCSIPKTYYSLPAAASFSIIENGNSYTVSFIPGNYTFQSFQNIFLSNVASSGASFTYNISMVPYNSNTTD